MLSVLIPLEILVTVIALAIVLLFQGTRSDEVSRRSFLLSRVAIQPRYAGALVGVVALIGVIGLSILFGIPQPRFHDEFSNLLLSDTLGRGRLVNPVHPLWMHFESFHILQQPTYASKFPPGQGLILAAGKSIGGHPIVGVWITVSLTFAAICWMLQAWVPKRWALFGAMLGILQVRFADLPLMPSGLLGYWSQSYWGGSLAALGGALVFGALPRVLRRPSVRHALLLGLGLAILANTRPFEGLVISLPIAVMLLSCVLRRNNFSRHTFFARVVIPIALVLFVAAGAMAFYNFRVTGSPLRFPYWVHKEAYMIAPLFVFQSKAIDKKYNHEAIRDFHTGWEFIPYERQQSISGLISETGHKLATLWGFYLGSVLTIPVIATLPALLRNRRMRLALASCGLLVAALLTVNWVLPHYGAPATCLVLLLVVQALRYLRLWTWRGKPIGRRAILAIPCALVVSNLIFFVLRMTYSLDDWSQGRVRLLSELTRQSGDHLVVVRYGNNRTSSLRDHAEWVYNEADIDHAKVVWAREMNAEQNRKLLEYFKQRHAWLLIFDGDGSTRLSPYPMASVSSMIR